MMEMKDALSILSARRTDELVVAPFTGALVWQDVTGRPEFDLPDWGAMGKSSSAGLGLALALPNRRVWVLDGDGSLLMNLGSLVTIAQMGPKNLIHVVLENGVYATTGGQPIPGAGTVDFPALASASGFKRTYSFGSVEELDKGLDEAIAGDGPVLLSLKVKPAGLPRERVEDRLPRRGTKQAIREMQEALGLPE